MPSTGTGVGRGRKVGSWFWGWLLAMIRSAMGGGPSSPGVAAFGAPLPSLSIFSFGVWFPFSRRDVLPVGFLLLELLLLEGLWCLGNIPFVLGALGISSKMTNLSTTMACLVSLRKLGLVAAVVVLELVKVLH